MKTQKFLSSLLAAALVASVASVAAFADTPGQVTLTAATALDADGVVVATTSGGTNSLSDGIVTLDVINPNQTIYIPLGTTDTTKLFNSSTGAVDATIPSGSTGIAASYLADSDYFKMSVDKDGTGKSLIKSVTQVSDKTLEGQSRNNYLKVELADSATTTDLKATIDITFKAKAAKTESAVGMSAATTNAWASGDYATLRVTMWINNTKVDGSDGSVDTGEGAYYNPTANEDNSLIWGDDRAALEFSTDDDASDFYAKLSTKTDSTIYSEYGDPVNADLWFYDFVGNPTIPATSRASLTLGIPWDEDNDTISTAPEDCFIYTLDSDGTLTDVSEQFTYSEDMQEIPGWTIKTRTLGTYIVSDTELALYADDVIEDTETDTETDTTDSTTTVDKEIPNTGSSDMVNVAVAAGVVSLAAAAALAFKKTAR